MDGRANWPAQVTSRIGLSSIGSLREHRDGSFDMESFRAAKARINGILPRGPYGRSLLVTSAHAKDGKTMVVSNLASSLAEDGSSVMIVSADVRSDTSIDGAWPGIDDRIGLSEYLNDDSIQLDDVIASTPESGISIVTRGRMPESIVPRIDSRRMGDLLDGLRERFDWIVLDGSAVLESADAARVSPLVDGTLLVIDGRRTTLSAAQSSADTLIGAGAGLIGFFHNRTRGNPMARMLRQEIG
jgi:Mrp family chromosome partitioning ATPase